MIKARMKTPDYRTFVNQLLPKVMDEVHKTILKKLNDASSLSLITDIWTNKQLKDFIAVAANIINEKFEKQLLVIGITRMPGNIMRKMLTQVKIVRLLCIYRIIINLCIFKGVENIVNKYAFDKSKLSSLFVFESSF
jgi:hypothetical protein